MGIVTMAVVGLFIVFTLIDIRTELKRANYLKEEELELFKKQHKL